MTTPRLGIVFTPAHDPARLIDVARAADAAGLDEFWLWEDCFSHGGLTTAATVLASTDRIQVGLGLMPAPLRNVALCAMEVASLHRLFPGRFLAGVGHGVQRWMGQTGARVASPMTLLDEYSTALRALLRGDEVTVDGRYVTLDAVRLQWPAPNEPFFLGGTGPKTLRYAASHSDGTLFAAAMSDDELAESCAEVIAARRSEDHRIIAPRLVAVGAGADDRIRDEVARWGKSDAHGLAVTGGAADVAREVTRLGQMGITSVVAHPTDDEPDLEGLVEVLGQTAAAVR
ncbi:oxidoreductase [Rhodococcus sp. Leaf7]|uniref:LLM class flavin-dependent oxidoreductase n=1 Tax=unclassified Rhodococcus (in: high G+C Gram-positive bacteria) TaxID=192944 RepID=UPI0006F77BA3|nr:MULTISPECIES: LLM class flavin-dependent oxidoreductase [unclassified Rhodococcus (in: high G+C Gram-positive bacteria)]KQU07621.1 oxidoreductase [Rhodococcus sp. Leaf7]KQU43141.1 oxidoreductase [Rhodococcus sp. Leaf247]